jgi:hypothetical protein
MTTRTHHSAPHIYIECDLPEGQTIAEWNRDRRPVRPARRGLRRLLIASRARDSRAAAA